MSTAFTAQVVLAAIGGLTISVLNLLELQNVPKERRPNFADPFYWLAFVAWPILGGLVAYLYSGSIPNMDRLLSFQIGLSTPLILRTMANVIPAPIQKRLPNGA